MPSIRCSGGLFYTEGISNSAVFIPGIVIQFSWGILGVIKMKDLIFSQSFIHGLTTSRMEDRIFM